MFSCLKPLEQLSPARSRPGPLRVEIPERASRRVGACLPTKLPKCRFLDCSLLDGRGHLCGCSLRASTRGVKMDPNFKAQLSPRKLASVRGLGVDSKRQISSSHRQLLLAMGFIVASDELVLPAAGHHRLNYEERDTNRSSTEFAEQGLGEIVEAR
jgi:hypothetical protein